MQLILNKLKLGYNEFVYNKLAYIVFGYNEHIPFSQIGNFITQISPVITNPGYDEQK